MVFVKKSNILSRVFISQIRPEKIVLDILDRKEGFLDQKSEVLKRPENRNFSKGMVHVFVKKSNILSRVSILQIRPGKIVF